MAADDGTEVGGLDEGEVQQKDPLDTTSPRRGNSDAKQDHSDGGATEGETDCGGEEDAEDEDDDDEEEDDEEPKLKYASLTKGQAAIYSNGDTTSAFLVGGDKMVIGTHNGNIHVLSLPSFQSLKVYHAHSASTTSVSISPFPPPVPSPKGDAVTRIVSEHQLAPSRSPNQATLSANSSKHSTTSPTNAIHIATSSIDGNVVIQSLMDPKDVLLRKFGRPVQAVALSPDYRNDRTYLSGGLAGNLIRTVGGRAGKSATSTTVGGAAATASGWLGTIGGTIGLGGEDGVDTVLHSGEGRINTIKWSLSGKYVVWVNEHGFKIMRSHLYLESAESEYAWKRLNHIDRPTREPWEEMAGVWRARAEWIDENGLEYDEDVNFTNGAVAGDKSDYPASDTQSVRSIRPGEPLKRKERLLVGWGDTIWIVDVHSPNAKDVGERKLGRVDVVSILRTDCIISGISQYTPNLLVVLAYVMPEGDSSGKDNAGAAVSGTPKKGVHRRQNALQPEMRIIDIFTKEEVCKEDTLNVSRYESLSATDYHLSTLPVARSTNKSAKSRGALGVIGDIGGGIYGGIWDASTYSSRLLLDSAVNVYTFSAQTVLGSGGKAASTSSTESPSNTFTAGQGPHPALLTRGMKIFVQSPYDCVLATKPAISDHLNWLDSHEKYAEAWKIIDQYPEAAGGRPDPTPGDSTPDTPTKKAASLQDFFDDASSHTTPSQSRATNINSIAEEEKRVVGDKWIQQLVKSGDWAQAGEVCGQVIGTSSSWERWVWVFADAGKYAEITPFIPTEQLRPPLSSTVYEVVLGHYISKDRLRLAEILQRWPPDLFDVGSVISAIESRLRIGDVRENSIEDGEPGRDWRILQESLAKLYLADGRYRDALKCYIRLQDANTALALITTHQLADAVSDDISGLILLRVTREQLKSGDFEELEEATDQPIRLLVSEAHQGTVTPETVISQLKPRKDMQIFLFFYLRAIWNGDTRDSGGSTKSGIHTSKADHLATEGKSLVNDFADTALPLFAEYDRPLLFDFLRSSQSYTLSLASSICEKRDFIPEHVYLLAKEGRTKKALHIIIDKLGDVSQAISFAKEQSDSDLWDDLLDYSMNKPMFIRALLEEVGTAIDPIKLVRRIPEGLEIEGLRESLSRMLKEFELQDSISEGASRVLRGEVAAVMTSLRAGQKKGVKFGFVADQRPKSRQSEKAIGTGTRKRPDKIKPGHCAGCGEVFHVKDTYSLIAFPCHHVFHLPCFLTYSAPPTDEDGLQNLDLPKPESETGRGVAAKVRYAKVLRGRVSGGCPVPLHP